MSPGKTFNSTDIKKRNSSKSVRGLLLKLVCIYYISPPVILKTHHQVLADFVEGSNKYSNQNDEESTDVTVLTNVTSEGASNSSNECREGHSQKGISSQSTSVNGKRN